MTRANKAFFFALHIRDFDLDAVAWGDFDGCAFTGHLFQRNGLVAFGMDDFQSIADGEAVFNFHRCPAFGVDFGNVSDVLALFGGGMAAEVVLVVLSLVAFEEAAGVAAVGEASSSLSNRSRTDGLQRRRQSLCGRTG